MKVTSYCMISLSPNLLAMSGCPMLSRKSAAELLRKSVPNMWSKSATVQHCLRGRHAAKTQRNYFTEMVNLSFINTRFSRSHGEQELEDRGDRRKSSRARLWLCEFDVPHTQVDNDHVKDMQGHTQPLRSLLGFIGSIFFLGCDFNFNIFELLTARILAPFRLEVCRVWLTCNALQAYMARLG